MLCKRLLWSLFPLLFALLTVFTGEAQAESRLVLENGKLMVSKGKGKSVPLPKDLITLENVENSDLRYLALSPQTLEGNKLGLKPGLFFMTSDNKLIHFTGTVPALPELGDSALTADELGDTAALVAVSLSPKGDIIALNWGYTSLANWLFFSWPDMKFLKHGAIPMIIDGDEQPLLWIGDKTVVTDDIDLETKRPCVGDPCGNTSVKAYNLTTGKVAVLFQGTDLCDYQVLGIEDGKVAAEKICMKKMADWEAYGESEDPNKRAKHAQKVFAPLP